jgi:hypothetical protein
MLERKGLLENAIVVVYSDHGESFGVDHEALVPHDDPLIHALKAEPAWGHGSTVLTAHQFRIVLGMRRFGADWNPNQQVAAPVSFEDIAPTLVGLLGLESAAHFDGKSLAPLIEDPRGADHYFAGRIRFTETEYELPADLATPGGEVSSSKLQDALSVYSIDRVTDRITIKPSHLPLLLTHRQYAAVGEKYLVAALPDKVNAGFNFIAVDLAGGPPRQLFDAPAAGEAELAALWDALHRKYEVIRASRQGVSASTVAKGGRTIPPSVTK